MHQIYPCKFLLKYTKKSQGFQTMYAITGGGTGGHLAIAKALAIALKEKKQPVIYIGSKNGQDMSWFEFDKTFDAAYFLHTTGVVNKKGTGYVNALLLQIFAIFEVRKIFKRHNIKAVISVGGFSAGPASIGAILFFKKLFIHEQNAIKGKLNQKLSPFAKIIFGSFENKDKNFMLTPYPVRQEFFLEQFQRTQVKTILFLGGSQGAVAINDFALSVATELLLRGYKIIHQCGSKDFERINQEYIKMEIRKKVELFSFDSNILKYIAKSDMCVCRAGASSIWELAASGIPCIYIPYPHAAGNHQYHNARFFELKDLGISIDQSRLNEKSFFEALDNISENISTMSKGLQNSIQKNGASKIISEIMQSFKEA